MIKSKIVLLIVLVGASCGALLLSLQNSQLPTVVVTNAESMLPHLVS